MQSGFTLSSDVSSPSKWRNTKLVRRLSAGAEDAAATPPFA